jgi:hypothetical protein
MVAATCKAPETRRKGKKFNVRVGNGKGSRKRGDNRLSGGSRQGNCMD